MKLLFSRRVLIWLLAGMTLAPAHIPASEYQNQHRHRPRAQEMWARTELYFGSNKPDGTVVTDADFMQFVDGEVTPRFPDGLTLVTGYGQFLNSEGVLEKERSMVLILFYPVTTLDAGKKIEEIRGHYKDQFRQESVLRVDSLTNVSF